MDCILGLGGNGDDYIDGGPGTDQCDGGGGTNTIINCENSAPTPTPTPKCDGEHKSGDSCKKEDVNASGGSSAASVSTPTPVPAPAAPSGLSAVQDGSAVKLTWSPVAGVAFYNVYRSETKGSGYLGIGSATTPAFTDSDVKFGTTYYYVVTAVGPTKAQSRESNEASATPLQVQSTEKPGRRTTPVPGAVGISVPGN